MFVALKMFSICVKICAQLSLYHIPEKNSDISDSVIVVDAAFGHQRSTIREESVLSFVVLKHSNTSWFSGILLKLIFRVLE